MAYPILTDNNTTERQRTGFLEIENLVKSYPTPDKGKFVVLNNINLTIGEDEYISVIGHSG
jgi:nitrate/nitrite transport system ATP-binding protein